MANICTFVDFCNETVCSQTDQYDKIEQQDLKKRGAQTYLWILSIQLEGNKTQSSKATKAFRLKASQWSLRINSSLGPLSLPTCF